MCNFMIWRFVKSMVRSLFMGFEMSMVRELRLMCVLVDW